MIDNKQNAAEISVEESQTEVKDVSRRKAFARFAAYTAPAMLALLASETAMAASPT